MAGRLLGPSAAGRRLVRPARPRARAAAPGSSAAERKVVAALQEIHRDILANGTCLDLVGPPVVGSPVPSRIYLLGQAPGPHEARLGRPFAWKAGRTLFGWLEQVTGAGEDEVRARVYIAAVVRSFPGKARSGGDRLPNADEIAACRGFIEREIEVLRPRLVIPVGRLAIREVLGHEEPIAAVVGKQVRAHFHGVEADVICLPHPSGASTWFYQQPGKRLLAKALQLLARHPEIRRVFGRLPGRRA